MIQTIGLTLLIYIVQKYLSTRKNGWLGVLVPLGTLGLIVYLYAQRGVSSFSAFLTVSFVLLLLEILLWIDGRHQFRKEELQRMKIKDLM